MVVRGGQAPVTPGKRRLAAFVVLACGLALAKFSIYDPMSAAERHEATISFSLRNAAFAVFAMVLGALLLVVSFLKPDAIEKFGHWGTNPETKRMNGKAITAALILTLVCFAIAFLIQTHIHNAGYDV